MGLAVPGYEWIGNNNTSGNDYVGGYPPSLCLHMTVSTGLSKSYAQSHSYPPHCWANPYTGDKWQALQLDRAGLALYQPPYTNSYLNRKYYCIQTELVGYPEVNIETYTHDQCDWIGRNVIAPQVQALRSVGLDVNLGNVRYHTNSSGSASEYWGGRMSDGEWAAFDGVCAHIDAVGNDHWDCSVERTDIMVQAAIAELGGSPGPGPKPTEDEDDGMKWRTFIDDTNTTYVVNGLEATPIGNPAIYSTLVAAGMVYTTSEQDAKGWSYRYSRRYMQDVFKILPMSEATVDAPY